MIAQGNGEHGEKAKRTGTLASLREEEEEEERTPSGRWRWLLPVGFLAGSSLMVGLDHLKGLFQVKRFDDSVVLLVVAFFGPGLLFPSRSSFALLSSPIIYCSCFSLFTFLMREAGKAGA